MLKSAIPLVSILFLLKTHTSLAFNNRDLQVNYFNPISFPSSWSNVLGMNSHASPPPLFFFFSFPVAYLVNSSSLASRFPFPFDAFRILIEMGGHTWFPNIHAQAIQKIPSVCTSLFLNYFRYY